MLLIFVVNFTVLGISKSNFEEHVISSRKIKSVGIGVSLGSRSVCYFQRLHYKVLEIYSASLHDAYRFPRMTGDPFPASRRQISAVPPCETGLFLFRFKVLR